MYKTIEEATLVKLDLVEKIQTIEVQLAERAAKVAVGRVPDEEYKAYLEWRVRACRAKASKASKLSRTKVEIQKLRMEAAEKRREANGGDAALFRDLYHLTKALIAAGSDITAEEQMLVDDVGSYLERT